MPRHARPHLTTPRHATPHQAMPRHTPTPPRPTPPHPAPPRAVPFCLAVPLVASLFCLLWLSVLPCMEHPLLPLPGHGRLLHTFHAALLRTAVAATRRFPKRTAEPLLDEAHTCPGENPNSSTHMITSQPYPAHTPPTQTLAHPHAPNSDPGPTQASAKKRS